MMRPCNPLLIVLLASTPALAQVSQAPPPPPAATQAKEEPSTFDKIWKFTEWYDDESNPVVQRVLFSGRYQHEYAGIDADEGDLGEWNVRRMRLGPRITLFRKFLFHAEVELNPQERDPFYVRFTDFYLQWNRSARMVLTVGKQGIPFTLEGATSSKDLLTIDRSNVANNIWFPQEYIPGVSVSGRHDRWSYRGGAYSPGAANREFGEFNGSLVTLATVGYDFSKSLGAKEALLTGSYVYQPADSDNTFTRQLHHIGSINFRFDTGRWGARGDFSAASGYLGQSSLWGVVAMPFYNVTDKFQVVGRYTFLESGDPNGVRLATYESRIVPGRGDRYHELYGGANYYFYGHRLKLQTGLQLADMNDTAADGGAYSGAAWMTGVRVGW